MIAPARILVALKGDSTDEEALGLACAIAGPTKAQIYAIHVIEVKRTLPVDVDLPRESARGEAILTRAESLAQGFSQRVEAELLQARDVGTAIVDEAVARSVDLIIIGLSYRRKFGEFDLGATAQYVLHTAPCRVWITRAAQVSAGESAAGQTIAGSV